MVLRGMITEKWRQRMTIEQRKRWVQTAAEKLLQWKVQTHKEYLIDVKSITGKGVEREYRGLQDVVNELEFNPFWLSRCWAWLRIFVRNPIFRLHWIMQLLFSYVDWWWCLKVVLASSMKEIPRLIFESVNWPFIRYRDTFANDAHIVKENDKFFWLLLCQCIYIDWFMLDITDENWWGYPAITALICEFQCF